MVAGVKAVRATEKASENAPVVAGKGRVTRATANRLKGKQDDKPRSVLGEIGNRTNPAQAKQGIKKATAPVAENQLAKKEKVLKERKDAKEKVVAKARFGSGRKKQVAAPVEQAPAPAPQPPVQRATRRTSLPKEQKEEIAQGESSQCGPAAPIDAPAAPAVPAPIEVDSEPEASGAPPVVMERPDSDLANNIAGMDLASAHKLGALAPPPILSAPLIDGEVAPGVLDIDFEDIGYPEFVPEYVKDIYSYLRVVEVNHHIGPDYMNGQSEITHKMRSILINWLVEVHQKFNLLQESLYLCVSLIDRYLSVQSVQRDKLQLVGATCMLIASKFEEIYAPEVRDFIYICEEAYTREEILEMERKILNTLKFRIGSAYALHFLRRMSKSADATPECHTMGKYLVELTITNPDMLKYKQSEIAAGCLYLSLKMLELTEWNATIEYYSGYTKAQVIPIATEMSAFIKNIDSYTHQATHKKYQSQRFYRIAYMVNTRIKEITLD